MDQRTPKSWVPAEGILDNRHFTGVLSLPKPQFGLRVILAVVTMLFFLLFVVYVSRMQIADWHPMPDPGILWLNTALLVLSSAALQWAKTSVDRGEYANARLGFFSGGILTWLFLAGQLIAWQQIRNSGYLLEGNPATSFFYLITLVHGLHLMGGLVAWLKTSILMVRGASLAQIGMSFKLCALYWHFMLVVWLIFYSLMLST